MSTDNSFPELINVRWKVDVCNSGEGCWCRLVMPETPVKFRGDIDAWVIPDGSVSKAEAEHIVEIHNAWLEMNHVSSWEESAEKAINKLLDAHKNLDREKLGTAINGLRILVGRV